MHSQRQRGPFVYRLGHVPFTDERGVRFPYGLQAKKISKEIISKGTSRDGAVVARRAHNPKVAGSSPAPATKRGKSPETVTFFILPQFKTLVNTGILRKKSFTFRVR